MKRQLTFLAISAVLGLLYVGGAPAQSPGAGSTAAASNASASSGPPDPAKAPLIEELFQLTKPEQAVQQSKNALSNAAQQSFDVEVRKFADPSKYYADRQKMVAQLSSVIDSRLSWPKLKPQFAKAYSDNFSKDELSGIIAFYKSAAGKAEMQKLPKVNYQCNLIGQQALAGLQPELQKTFTDTISGIRQRANSGSTTPSSGAKPPASSTSPK